MYYVSMEIQTPEGRHETRRTQWLQRSIVLFPGYIGEPLEPGDAVLMVFYPNFSQLEATGGDDQNLDRHVTFPKTGRYFVRLVYSVPKFSRYLETDEVRSNQVELTFRAPDLAEVEILAAVWNREGWLVMEGPYRRI
jgi:hypothetical protein